MKIHVIPQGQIALEPEAALVIPIYEDTDLALGNILTEADTKTLTALHGRSVFTGKAQECYTDPTPHSPYGAAIVIGLGSHEDFDAEVLRRCAGKVAKAAQVQRCSQLVLDVTANEAIPVEAFIEGIMLGQYDYIAHKTPSENPPVLIDDITIMTASEENLVDLREGCARAAITCKNVNWARDLGNIPPNDLTPTALAAQAESMAKETGMDCTIFDEAAMNTLGMNGILCVSAGSAEEARLIILEYKHPDAEDTIALVGKGITFDTGGISIKPGDGMEEMKFDMLGAAAVLGAMKTIAELKPAVNVVCAVPTSENKTGAGAYVPGDIIKMYNGMTVEVHNTDAEGRMVLADALAYTVEKYKPGAIVDAATLTGACVVALGHYAAGVFANNDDLVSDLELAALASGERIWQLPLWPDYEKLVDGTHADICNIGPRGEAGAITAAAFLKRFVGDTPWAHVDIAGTAWGGKHISYLDPNHATGYGVRLFTQWAIDVAQAKE